MKKVIKIEINNNIERLQNTTFWGNKGSDDIERYYTNGTKEGWTLSGTLIVRLAVPYGMQ